VRNRAILGIFGLAALILPGLNLMAYTFEAHPGLYTAYEYTDNYRGDVQNEQSESIYYVGPSLSLNFSDLPVTFDLTGRYTKSFHQRFPEDDSPDVNLTSHASYTTQRQSARLSYGFDRTLTREYLSEPFGEVKRNTGSILYNFALSQHTSVDAGYNFQTDRYSGNTSDEDLTSMGGNVGITHQLDPQDTISLAAQRSYYNYEISQDATTSNGSFHFRHSFSPVFSAGLDPSYNRDDRGSDPSSDIYNAEVSVQYAFNQTTSIDIRGGYSWLFTEHQDRQTDYTAHLSLDKRQDYNRFNLIIAKEYTSEFTNTFYGTYDTTSMKLAWDRQWLKEWSSAMAISAYKRRPTNGTAGEDETDSAAHVKLNWNPNEYFTGSLSYDHLITKYETSGTARENRYMMAIEVRY
jgi:hypothetical protein